jgi:hypothetical protein
MAVAVMTEAPSFQYRIVNPPPISAHRRYFTRERKLPIFDTAATSIGIGGANLFLRDTRNKGDAESVA